jgi:hypothetical protein
MGDVTRLRRQLQRELAAAEAARERAASAAGGAGPGDGDLSDGEDELEEAPPASGLGPARGGTGSPAEQVFRAFDTDGDGLLSCRAPASGGASDFVLALRALGRMITVEQEKDALRGHAQVSLPDFKRIAQSSGLEAPPEPSEVLEALSQLGAGSYGTRGGRSGLERAGRFLDELAPSLKREDRERIVALLDAGGAGRVTSVDAVAGSMFPLGTIDRAFRTGSTLASPRTAAKDARERALELPRRMCEALLEEEERYASALQQLQAVLRALHAGDKDSAAGVGQAVAAALEPLAVNVLVDAHAPFLRGLRRLRTGACAPGPGRRGGPVKVAQFLAGGGTRCDDGRPLETSLAQLLGELSTRAVEGANGSAPAAGVYATLCAPSQDAKDPGCFAAVHAALGAVLERLRPRGGDGSRADRDRLRGALTEAGCGMGRGLVCLAFAPVERARQLSEWCRAMRKLVDGGNEALADDAAGGASFSGFVASQERLLKEVLPDPERIAAVVKAFGEAEERAQAADDAASAKRKIVMVPVRVRAQ